MLFSNRTIADYIERHFEPVWVSVRDAPKVTIDFGAGNVVQRTLHGNVATSLCDAEGRVLDILPGLYHPHTYLLQLEQLRNLAIYLQQESAEIELADVHRAYHRRQAGRLEEKDAPLTLQRYSQGISILGREIGVKVVLAPLARLNTRAARLPGAPSSVADYLTPEQFKPPGEFDEKAWKLLEEDTDINEQVRRKLVHEKLAESGPVAVDDLTKWLYRDVLKADLDDPYLGLGDLIKRSNPFEGARP